MHHYLSKTARTKGRKQATRRRLQKNILGRLEAGAHLLSEGFPEWMGFQHQDAAEPFVGRGFRCRAFQGNQYLDWRNAANRCEKNLGPSAHQNEAMEFRGVLLYETSHDL